mmetsp:Transcript_4161/g.11308  ORF Transcript_4161/g.11308 Transcript_4161/m.11308 type:complete len:216 (+) Transcript_4161:576-1223(+)
MALRSTQPCLPSPARQRGPFQRSRLRSKVRRLPPGGHPREAGATPWVTSRAERACVASPFPLRVPSAARYFFGIWLPTSRGPAPRLRLESFPNLNTASAALAMQISSRLGDVQNWWCPSSYTTKRLPGHARVGPNNVSGRRRCAPRKVPGLSGNGGQRVAPGCMLRARGPPHLSCNRGAFKPWTETCSPAQGSYRAGSDPALEAGDHASVRTAPN